MNSVNSSNANKAIQIANKNYTKGQQQLAIQENLYDVRNSRMGFRGCGLYQLSRYSTAEGVFIVDVGGSKVVGK